MIQQDYAALVTDHFFNSPAFSCSCREINERRKREIEREREREREEMGMRIDR